MKLRCKLGLHLWSYGGHKENWSDGSHSIFSNRVCILCYLLQWWMPGWYGKGKARWIKYTNIKQKQYGN